VPDLRAGGDGADHLNRDPHHNYGDDRYADDHDRYSDNYARDGACNDSDEYGYYY
jgi:hypothetical protein